MPARPRAMPWPGRRAPRERRRHACFRVRPDRGLIRQPHRARPTPSSPPPPRGSRTSAPDSRMNRRPRTTRRTIGRRSIGRWPDPPAPDAASRPRTPRRGNGGSSRPTGEHRRRRSRAGDPRPAHNTRGLVELRRHRSRCRWGARQKTDRPRFLAGGQRSGLTREASVAISDDDGRPARRGRAERPRREPGRPRRS